MYNYYNYNIRIRIRNVHRLTNNKPSITIFNIYIIKKFAPGHYIPKSGTTFIQKRIQL